MEQLIKGKTAEGKYYVRPMNWAGQWDSAGKLCYGNTLFESESDRDCDIYIEVNAESERTFDCNAVMECLTDNEKLKKLIAENPELPIMYMCGEECYCDDYGYTINTGSYQIEEITLADNMICDDKDELEEKIYDNLNRKYHDASEKLLDILTKDILGKYVWKKVITVRLG